MSDRLWKLTQVTLRGRLRPRLDRVSLEIARGTTAVIGCSGAGKTSLLNLLVGFERPDSGTMQIVPGAASDRLSIYWSPPDCGLWPQLTVNEHLQAVAPGGAAATAAIRELLDEFDLLDQSGDRPASLSQGERTRLAVARALASRATVLVLDEPLVHVDASRLENYWQAIRRHCDETGTSLVIATHSPERVLREAGQVICLQQGRVRYCGAVDELYDRPASAELAEFLGPANWLSPEDAQRWLGGGETAAGCVRPERIEIARAQQSRLVVERSMFAGSVAEVELRDEQTDARRTFLHRPAKHVLRAGDRVSIRVLLTFLLCWLASGCTSEHGPQLDVQSVKYWSMPSEGKSVPAPRSVTIAPNNDAYVLDNAGRVLVFNAAGKVIRRWTMPEYDVGKPEGICVFRDGRIGVADTHYHRVVFFDTGGKVTGMFGELGRAPGQFIYPVAIIQDDQENFYVGEYGENDRVQKFSVDGKFLLQFGSFGTEPGQFQRPSGLVWLAGKLYVTDAFNNRVQVFTDDGKFLAVLGDQQQSASLHYPYHLASDGQNQFYVVEYGAGRVTKLDLSGRLLGRFGRVGNRDGELLTPWGLAVGPADRVLVADTGNRRIVELRL